MNHAMTGIEKARSYNGDYMRIGKAGETVCLNWLRQHPGVCDIIDFRAVRAVHECDIDCGVKLYTGNICLVEIKTDTYLGVTGNILCEVLRINHTCEPNFAGYLGWMLRSPAKYLLYYAPNRIPSAIYKAEFALIRRVIQDYTQKNNPRIDIVRTDNIKTTFNLLIPALEFNSIFEIYDISGPGPHNDEDDTLFEDSL
jgi:hypothetical protein